MYLKHGKRHQQLILLSIGTIIDSALKVNMSFAIVAMTNSDGNLSSAPVMSWTPLQQGLVLSSFFLGYLIFQIPSGFLSSRFSPVHLLTFSFVIAGLLTCLSPVAAVNGGYLSLVIARIVTGLAQGIIYPSVKTLLSKWAVPLERSRFYSCVFGGASLGSALTMLWGGVLSETSIGWPLLFYSSGALSVTFGAIFFILAADSPDAHKSISDSEKLYIAKSFGCHCADNEGVPIPWTDILVSYPVWALAFTHAAGCWGYWTVLSLTPSYIHRMNGISWSQNGYLSAIPSFVNFIIGILLAFLDDSIHKNVALSKRLSRKLWNTLAFWGTAGALTAMSLLKTNAIMALSLLSFATAINCLTNMGYLINHTDLSPNFAGTLFGLTNTFANLASVLGPLISFTMLTNMKEDSEWKIVFGIAAIVMFVGNLVFLLFGSVDVQPWNAPKNKYVLEKPPVDDAAVVDVEGVGSIKNLDPVDASCARFKCSNIEKPNVAQILRDTMWGECQTVQNENNLKETGSKNPSAGHSGHNKKG